MDGGFRDGERVVIREERILSSRGEIRSSLGNELPVDSRLVPCNYKLVRFSRGIAWGMRGKHREPVITELSC